MTSQSPAKSGFPTPEYMNAWMGTRAMLMQGASWSGRERNHVFLNVGGGRFVDVSPVSGADCIGDGRSAVPIDWDGDGLQDLFLKSRTGPRLQFFHNRSPERGGFVEVVLEGVTCNRDAIGARVELAYAGRTVAQTLHAGDGYLAQGPKILHFGLGDAETVERLSILWPDGERAAYEGLAANARYLIRQGAGAPERVQRPRMDLAPLPAASTAPAAGSRVRVPLAERIPLEPLAVPSYREPTRTVRQLAGRPVLLNLWSRDCAACMQELAEFRDRRADLEATRLRIVPLCTDGGADAGARARPILKRFRLAADAGPCDAEFLAALELLLGEVLGTVEETPLPLSLLLDPGGRLAVLYLGRLEVDRLLRDLRLLDSGRPLMRGVRFFPQRRGFASLAEGFEELGRSELAGFFRARAEALEERRER